MHAVRPSWGATTTVAINKVGLQSGGTSRNLAVSATVCTWITAFKHETVLVVPSLVPRAHAFSDIRLQRGSTILWEHPTVSQLNSLARSTLRSVFSSNVARKCPYNIALQSMCTHTC
jgi:hypothetical protein